MVPPGRSCAACKRRKIRCDRGRPCVYCQRLGLDCTYPEEPLSTSKLLDPNGTISRLERIEHLLMKLTEKVAMFEEWRSEIEDGENTEPRRKRARRPRHGNYDDFVDIDRNEDDHQKAVINPGSSIDVVVRTDHEDLVASQQPSQKENQGKKEGNLEAPRVSNHDSLQRLGPFLEWNRELDLTKLHPPRPNILALWKVYSDSVDPLLKVLHIPSTERDIAVAMDDLANTPAPTQALMFSIYYAAVTGMRYSVSAESLPFEVRKQRLMTYELGLQQALVKSDFMTKSTIQTIQAMVIYLFCALYHGRTAYAWSMSGLLVRLAMSANLHRESTGRDKLESELRRRLWWAILVIDSQIAEMCGTDPSICDSLYDVRIPADVDDVDLSPGSEFVSQERSVSSQMIFTLGRIQMTQVFRKVTLNLRTTVGTEERIRVFEGAAGELDSLLIDLNKQCLLDTGLATTTNLFTAVAMRIMIARLKQHISRSSNRKPSTEVAFVKVVDRPLPIELDSQEVRMLRADPTYARWAWILDVDGVEGHRADS